jgi:CRISPR-associated protein Cas1
MVTLYLTKQGSSVKYSKSHILIYYKEKVISDYLISEISKILCFGNIQLSTKVITSMLENGKQVCFLSQYGHIKGSLQNPWNHNVLTRHKQHLLFNDKQEKLLFAKKIVIDKIYSALDLLLSYARNPQINMKTSDLPIKREWSTKVYNAKDANQLLGYEGSFTRSYFSLLKICFSGDVEFVGRKYRPSTDPVNALLSFGYSLVNNQIIGQIEAVGLDPYIGCYHVISYGRPSLVLDLMEVYRHALVDRLVLRVFNHRWLNSDDFETRLDDREGQLYLKPDKLPIFLKHFHKAISGPCTFDKKMTWREHIQKYLVDFKNQMEESFDTDPYRVVDAYHDCPFTGGV